MLSPRSGYKVLGVCRRGRALGSSSNKLESVVRRVSGPRRCRTSDRRWTAYHAGGQWHPTGQRERGGKTQSPVIFAYMRNTHRVMEPSRLWRRWPSARSRLRWAASLLLKPEMERRRTPRKRLVCVSDHNFMAGLECQIGKHPSFSRASQRRCARESCGVPSCRRHGSNTGATDQLRLRRMVRSATGYDPPMGTSSCHYVSSKFRGGGLETSSFQKPRRRY